MKKYIYILMILIINANYTKSQPMVLPGKIVVRLQSSKNGLCYFYENSNRMEFSMPCIVGKKYSGLSWLNKTDAFVAVEDIVIQNGKITHSNFVVLDTTGNIVRRVLDMQEGQYVGLAFSSISDSLLVFVTEKETKELGPLNEFYRPNTITIINLESGKTVKQMPDFCGNNNFDMCESPWSPDENRLVYSIVSSRNFTLEGEKLSYGKKPLDGVYVYDLRNDTHNRIAPKGHKAVWSPKGEQIAFVADNRIYLHNLVSGKTETLYKPEFFEKLQEIHWTPDGNYLFVICPKYYGRHTFAPMKYDEKLIRISDKKKVAFKKANIGFNSFTWKGV